MDLIKKIINKETGNITIVALILLVGLTFIGISASRTSTTDMLIARNSIPHKQDFYVSEGGQNREASEIGVGNYPVTNIESTDTVLATQAGMARSTDPSSLPGGDNHLVLGSSYDFSVRYKGYYPPPTGYSIIHFSRYDFNVDTSGGDSGVGIDARYYKIGPRAE